MYTFVLFRQVICKLPSYREVYVYMFLIFMNTKYEKKLLCFAFLQAWCKPASISVKARSPPGNFPRMEREWQFARFRIPRGLFSYGKLDFADGRIQPIKHLQMNCDSIKLFIEGTLKATSNMYFLFEQPPSYGDFS